MSKLKKRLPMVCPCCDGEVTHQRYGFDVIRPPKITTWLVCDQCEKALKGDDHEARHAIERAFIDFLEGLTRAPTA